MNNIEKIKLLNSLGIDSGEHIWQIEISRDSVIAIVINDSIKLVPLGKVPVPLTKNDSNILSVYYEGAVLQLSKLLSRYCEPLLDGGIEYANDKVVYKLVVGDNHDDNQLTILKNASRRYVADVILESFYGIADMSEQSLKSVRSCLHARKRSVARKVRPIL